MRGAWDRREEEDGPAGYLIGIMILSAVISLLSVRKAASAYSPKL